MMFLSPSYDRVSFGLLTIPLFQKLPILYRQFNLFFVTLQSKCSRKLYLGKLRTWRRSKCLPAPPSLLGAKLQKIIQW